MHHARRYGVKLDAAALLQDWVRDIGSKAGLGLENTNILSGAVGVPESRLEARILPVSRACLGLMLALLKCAFGELRFLAGCRHWRRSMPVKPGVKLHYVYNRRLACSQVVYTCVFSQLEVEFESLAELEQFWGGHSA